jgi:16S rRNA (adenine1518-N6/adenine1519-N6)-dimethyltransferase
MKITSPTELQRFLSEHDLSAKKSASQNFLIDGNIVRKILAEAKISKDDLVLEIGPGPGALTESFLETGCQVLAIERDAKLAPLLKRFPGSENLSIICADFLQFPLEKHMKKILPPGKKAKVVANLPYHITTPILSMLLPLHRLFSDLVIMVQKEVADRFIAEKGTKDYSSFTLFLQFFSEVSYCFTVDPNCFHPKPSIQSAVVHLKLRPPPSLSDPESFFLMLRTAFGQRRKMMRASLKKLFPSSLVESSLEKIGKNPLLRPEDLSLDEFIKLYEILSSKISQTH